MTVTKSFTQLTSLLLGASLMSALTACSDNVSSGAGKGKRQNPNPIEQELKLEGKYEAKLASLNSSVSGFTTAKAKLHLVGDSITAEIAVKDSPAMTIHSQFIYTANECPSEVHDTNSDGFIDPIEAAKVLGQILIPLDAELNSQLEGVELFPVADVMGSYVYYKEGITSKMVTDLQSPDLDINDELAKLKSNEELKLDGKVIVIQGVPEDIYLPGSVRTFNGLSERSTLAIACGKITRVINEESETTEPEVIY